MSVDDMNNAARCQHILVSGDNCNAPALRGGSFCRFHAATNYIKPDFSLPVIDDHTSLQYAIMQVLQALAAKKIDPRTASATLYGLQLAMTNLRQFRYERQDARRRTEPLAYAIIQRLTSGPEKPMPPESVEDSESPTQEEDTIMAAG